MDRIGESRFCGKRKHVFEEHIFERVTKWTRVKFNGESFVHRYELTVPCAEGAKSSGDHDKYHSIWIHRR